MRWILLFSHFTDKITDRLKGTQMIITESTPKVRKEVIRENMK
jgi:hypothetical protein